MIEKYLRDSISRPDLEKRMLEANLLSTMHIKDPPKKPSKPIKKKAN
jgi:hypothetical protein